MSECQCSNVSKLEHVSSHADQLCCVSVQAFNSAESYASHMQMRARLSKATRHLDALEEKKRELMQELTMQVTWVFVR